MKSIFNKANVPYLVSGALATIALSASGVFAIAPYIGFLAPVAALSVGLPLIIVGAVFSVIAIALSCAAISKNNTIAEKNKVIDQKTKDIKCKDNLISRKKDELNQQNNEIVSLKEKLSNKEIEVQNYKNLIDEKGVQTAEKKDNSVSKLATGESKMKLHIDKSQKENVRRKTVIDNSRNGAKNAYSTLVESIVNQVLNLETILSILGGVSLILTKVRSVVPYVGFNVAITD